jgi:hypothetical protein
MSRIRVTIDRLALRGFEPAAGKSLAQALERELGRILADPATRAQWTRSRRTPVLRLGAMPLEPGVTGAGKLGAGIARAIGQGARP